MSLTLASLCNLLEPSHAARLVVAASAEQDGEQGEKTMLRSFSTDTRSITTGDVFVALKGPNHDAHAHAADAVARGASALVVERELDLPVAQLVVADTRAALGAIAAIWCQQYAARRIAITGSNGKTTVKEMVAAILRAACDTPSEVVATQGNLNNDIGLPLTALGIHEQHRYAVLEMGASFNGEIAYLSDIAKPHIALVNSIAAAHLEGFGSLAAVAREKSSIFSGLDANGIALIPDSLLEHEDYADVLRQASAHCKPVTFGFSENADIRASSSMASTAHVVIGADVDSTIAGEEFDISLPLLGKHNLHNALAAIAVCAHLDVTRSDIVTGLASMQPVPGRLQLRDSVSEAVAQARVIDDTYNANPSSVRVAIDVLAGYSGKRVLVLGDMKELGAGEMDMHAEAGRYAKASGIECLITIGTLAAHAASEFGENAASFVDKQDIAWLLKQKLGPAHTVLFKGSRGARMEEIIDLLGAADTGAEVVATRSGAGGYGADDGPVNLYSGNLQDPQSSDLDAMTFGARKRLLRRVAGL